MLESNQQRLGDNTRNQAAANSIASGKPSKRDRFARLTLCWSPNLYVATMARARSRKSRTAGDPLTRFAGSWHLASEWRHNDIMLS